MLRIVEDIVEEYLEELPQDDTASPKSAIQLAERSKIGQNVARLRRLNCLSQSVLGKLVGLNQQDISRIELGKRRLDAVEAMAIANVLGVELSELFEGVI